MRGYASIKIYGLNLTRLPDQLNRRGIMVFGVKIGKKELLLSVKASQHKQAAAFLEEMCYKYETTGYNGLYSLLFAAKTNIVIVIAVFVLLLAVMYTNTLCWQVSIETGTLAADNQVRQLLQDSGVKAFCRKSIVKYDDLENLITNSISGAEYTFIAFKGNTLSVKITPRAIVEPIVDYSAPNDIIANKDGVVTRVVTLKGTARVKVGDSVVKGQTLIEGIVIYPDQTTMLVCAIGEVFLEVTSKGTANYVPIKPTYIATGKTMRITEYKVFMREVKSIKSIRFEHYDVSVKEHILSPMPVTLRNIKVSEYKVVLINQTFSEQLDELKREAYNNAFAYANFDVEKTDYEVTGGQKVTAILSGEVSGGIYKSILSK